MPKVPAVPHDDAVAVISVDGHVCPSKVSDADARKVLYENAAAVYGFDVDRLRPDVERVGFRLDDVRVETGSDTTEMTRHIRSRPAPVGR